MNLRQQIVKDRVIEASQRSEKTEDQAFLFLAHSLVTGRSLFDCDLGDIVDGGQDKQIDIMTIEQDDENVCLYILQVKNSESFSSNSLIQMKNGLWWIFNSSRADVNSLKNKKFQDKILEYRSIQSSVGPSNISVNVYYVTNGTEENISSEFNKEAELIRDSYDNDTFNSFKLEIMGAESLVRIINETERSTRKINADIKFRYDVNNPSLIKYSADELKGIVCSVSALEIARIVSDDAAGAIFDSNIRRFLGTRGAVNKDIIESCTNPSAAHQFWFLNNGITIVCDWFDAVTDSDNPHVKIKNLQIVNGCQTATSIALAFKQGNLKKDVRVVLRVYETKDKAIVDRIVLSTNNQNKITDRDLRANDGIQVDIERGFTIYGLFYERKPRQYDKDLSVNYLDVVSNEHVAQAYLAIVLRRPSDARRRKYKVWGELYHEIFRDQAVEKYILPFFIVRVCDEYIATTSYKDSEITLIRKVANNGIYHIARATSFLWRNGDSWSDQAKLISEVKSIYSNHQQIYGYAKAGFDVVCALIKSDPSLMDDIDKTLKSSTLDSLIDKELYKKQLKLPV